MSDFVDLIIRGASRITPSLMEKVLRKLPKWKTEFAQIHAPAYPHLVDQLEFLANVVEDVCENAYSDLPYFAFAESVFALTYAQKELDIIPDSVEMGRADDSSVVRAVLIRNEAAFQKYARANHLNWEQITSKP